MTEQKSRYESNYVEREVIGRGNFGSVHLVEEIETGHLWVSKKVPLSSLSSEDQTNALQEANLLRTLEHPHIVQYHESFIEKDTLIIIMEYCEGKLRRRRLV